MNTEPIDGTGQQRQAEVPEATLPVIAVFGGAEDEITLEAAEQIGYEIGLNQAILLTGGDDPNARDLKARVLRGALRARQAGATAPWVGVVRAKMATDPEPAADSLSLVLTPGGKHLRNFVEADLCDAAIAFEGGDGTGSEVVFCLALGKPLVLVGDPWLSKYPVVPGVVARDALKEEAQRRIPLPRADDHERLGPPIKQAYERFDHVVEPSFKHFALPPNAPASAVVEAATLAAETRSRPAESAASLRDDERAAIRQFRASLRSGPPG